MLVHVPPLEQIYFGNENQMDEIQWKILRWIMSFSSTEIETIKQLPKEFRLTSTVLYVLFKVKKFIVIFFSTSTFIDWQ